MLTGYLIPYWIKNPTGASRAYDKNTTRAGRRPAKAKKVA